MTTAQRISYALRLPWTVLPTTAPDSPRMLRIRELPEFLVVEQPGRNFEEDFWDALEGLVRSYVEHNDPIPEVGNVTVDALHARMTPSLPIHGRIVSERTATFAGGDVIPAASVPV
ncbi:hypothetical protein tb265_20250 [Gemmatimonadetes bacterium T265]|nr:hypothetical protein tb265_20250 [Gemmatimonadetes bacterium T265]